MTQMIKKLMPLSFIIVAMIVVISTGLHRYITLDNLYLYEQILQNAIIDNPFWSNILFIVIYIVAVALSLPIALILTLSSGFIFGTLWGGILTIIGATLGASIIFLSTRYALRDFMIKKAGHHLTRFETGLQKHENTYLLAIRLIPLFPFFLINIIAALVGVKFKTFFFTTAIGISPATFIYASIGNGLSHVIRQGKEVDPAIIFETSLFLPLTALGLLVLLPMIIKKFINIEQK